MTDEARRARAAQRANWPIRVVTLADEREPDVSAFSASERVAMVWRLTLDAWASRGEPIPAYAREHTPGRVVRRDG